MELVLSQNLLLMRHANAQSPSNTVRDFDRVLNEKGRINAEKIGRITADEKISPDIIFCSAAQRAVSTANSHIALRPVG